MAAMTGNVRGRLVVMMTAVLVLTPGWSAEPAEQGLRGKGVAEQLSRAYADRLARLEAIRERVAAGEIVATDLLEELIDEPRTKERLEIAFEREYLAGLERFFLEQERIRREARAAAEAAAEASRAEQTETTDTTSGSQAEAEPAVEAPASAPPLTEAEIRASAYPEPLADLLYEEGRFAEARLAYESVPVLDSGVRSEWVMYRTAQCLWKTGELDAADAAFGATMQAYPGGEWLRLCELGRETIELEKMLRAGGDVPGAPK